MKKKHRDKIQNRLNIVREYFERARTTELMKRINKLDPQFRDSDLHNKLEIFYTLLEKDIPDMLQELSKAKD